MRGWNCSGSSMEQLRNNNIDPSWLFEYLKQYLQINTVHAEQHTVFPKTSNGTMLRWDTWKNLCSEGNSDILNELQKTFGKEHHDLFMVRQLLPEWVEKQDGLLEVIDPENPDYDDQAREIYQDLMGQFSDVIGFDQLQYSLLEEKLKKNYEECPMNLVRALKTIMESELKLLKRITNSRDVEQEERTAGLNTDVDQKLQTLLTEAARKLATFHQEEQELEVELRNLKETGENIQRELLMWLDQEDEQNGLNQQIVEQIQDLLCKWKHVSVSFQALCHQHLQSLNQHMVEVIDSWRLSEKLSITGLASNQSLDEVDKLCGDYYLLLVEARKLCVTAATVFNTLKEQVDLHNSDLSDTFEIHEGFVKKLQETFKTKCFVISQQPTEIREKNKKHTNPCIIKFREQMTETSYSFRAEIRALGGRAFLEQASIKFKASLHLEDDLAISSEPDMPPPKDAAKVKGSEVVVEKQDSGHYAAVFKSMTLQCEARPKTGSKRKAQASRMQVTESVCGMVFTAMLDEKPLQVFSHPVVLVTHGSQERNALGTIIWDRAFSELDRKPYERRKKVQWKQLAEVLSALFKMHTGKGLEEHELEFLYKRLLEDCMGAQVPANRQIQIPLENFCKKSLPERDFTFWVWFYACLNLIKKHLKKEWKKGLIYGFVGKNAVENLLRTCPDGTFLIRFSKSEIEESQKVEPCGYLTLAFIEKDPITKKKKLYHIIRDEGLAGTGAEPYFCSVNFDKGLTLNNILKEIEGRDTTRTSKSVLRYLYPDIPFLKAFGLESPKKVPETNKKEKREKFPGYVQTQRHRTVQLAKQGTPLGEPHMSPANQERMDDVMEMIKEESLQSSRHSSITNGTRSSSHSPPATQMQATSMENYMDFESENIDPQLDADDGAQASVSLPLSAIQSRISLLTGTGEHAPLPCGEVEVRTSCDTEAGDSNNSQIPTTVTEAEEGMDQK